MFIVQNYGTMKLWFAMKKTMVLQEKKAMVI